MHIPHRRAAAECLFEPMDCLINARLQQMSLADSEVPMPESRVTGTEPDCALLSEDRVVHRPDIGLAPTHCGQRANKVAVESERRFILGNRLRVSTLSTKHLRHRV